MDSNTHWTGGSADSPSSTLPRVAIVAEHASARFGGEAILPLHYFRVLTARGAAPHLVVHERTREELSARFPDVLDHIHFVPDTAFHRFLDRRGRRLPGAVRHFTAGWMSRFVSQRAARRIVRELIARRQIDLVHQPIPVSPRETSLLFDLGVPVVIGPMNGAMSYPPAFANIQGGGTRFTRLARQGSVLVNRLIPGKLRADALLVANERTRSALPQPHGGRVVLLAENGVDLSLWRPAAPDEARTADAPVRFVFSGRLVDWKAVDLLIDAFHRVRAEAPATLEIVGDGPMRPMLEAQVDRLNLRGAVTFHGWQPQPECARLIRSSDAFVLPSVYECGGAVVLEAMACALPVIATAWGGPADYLDNTCGILIPPISREQMISDFSSAMRRLAQMPDLRRQMGEAGRQRVVADYDWERKVDQMLSIYREVLSKHPPFAMFR